MSAVVVGVSPTSGSPMALRFGAEEARLRSIPLRAVMAWRPPRPPASPGGRPPASTTGSPEESAVDAESTLRTYVDTALGSDANIECSVVRGSAVNALVTAAQDAAMLVIGEPNLGAMSKARTSLVAPQVVLKAECPVVVMPAAVRVPG
jgi:nucleotide-binding universal stress UspA family protein